jgi:hypothetical protein
MSAVREDLNFLIGFQTTHGTVVIAFAGAHVETRIDVDNVLSRGECSLTEGQGNDSKE